MIEKMGRTQIPPERTEAKAPSVSKEPSAGGESGTGFDQALDSALDIGSEAVAAAAAMATAMPRTPSAGEELKASVEAGSEVSEPGREISESAEGVALAAAAADKPAAAPKLEIQPADEKAAQPKLAASGKLASMQAQDNVLEREGAVSPLEERSSGRLEAMMGTSKPWDSSWIREGRARPDQAAKPESRESTSAAAIGAEKSGLLNAEALAAKGLGDALGHSAPKDASAPESTMMGASQGASIQKLLQPGAAIGNGFEGATVERVRAFDPEGAIDESGLESDEGPAAKGPVKVLGGSDFLSMLRDLKDGGAAASKSPVGPEAGTASLTTQGAGHTLLKEPGIRELAGAPLKPGNSDSSRVVNIGAGAAGATAATSVQSGPPIEVSGQVVPGPMSRERLATASVANLSAGINGMKGQGGEMKLRLKPDNLGELQLQVSTQGNQVSVKVHASSNQAKEILEESLSALKDSLAGHKLMLGKIEIVTGGQQSAEMGSGTSQHQSQQFAGDFGGSRNSDSSNQMGGDGGRSSGGSDSHDELSSGMTTALPGARRMAASAAAARASGRLDVMA